MLPATSVDRILPVIPLVDGWLCKDMHRARRPMHRRSMQRRMAHDCIQLAGGSTSGVISTCVANVPHG